MAEEFDYGALWSITQDALNEVNALTGAILQLPFDPISPWACSNPRPGAYEKWQAELKTVPERRAKAVDAIRKAAEKLAKLLAEDRFIAPVAGVWPPSAPEIARRVSSGLGMAASAARAVIACKDDARIGQFKSSAVDAQWVLQAAVAELARRTDVAELAYQRQVEQLRAEHPDWSGAEIAVKAAGGKPPEEPAVRADLGLAAGQAAGGASPEKPAGQGRDQVSARADDAGAYLPAKQIEEVFALSHKRLLGFLDAHPEVQRDRPKTRKGKPHPRRLVVHILDFVKAARNDASVAGNPEIAKRIEGRLHRIKVNKQLEEATLAMLHGK